MQDNTVANFTRQILLSDNEPTWSPTNDRTTRSKRSAEFSPDENIDLWLTQNAPLSFESLASIRYALYHHCNRAEFTVSMLADDQFKLTGRHSTLNVINDDARHYLLWRLRLLGRKNKWICALPQRKPAKRAQKNAQGNFDRA